jgi:hypothetical protein
MTVQSGDIKTIVVAAGETTFPYFFQVASGDDVKVYFTVAGVDVLQTEYTVDVLDLVTGGNVTFSEAPAVGTRITMFRETTRDQQTDYVENDPFPAETHEATVDKLTMLVQELEERIDRCIRLPISDLIETTTELPPLEDRILKFVYFDQNGNITTADGIMIESLHTHTDFNHLTISGILTSEYEIHGEYLSCEDIDASGDVDILGNLTVGGNTTIGSDGSIATVVMTVVSGITADSITTTTGTITNLTVDTLNVSTLSLDDNIDLPGYITLGTDDGLKLMSEEGTAYILSQDNGTSTASKLIIRTTNSDDDGGDAWDVMEATYDETYGHQVKMNENYIFGKNYVATDIDYNFPTYYADADNHLGAGNGMYFHILSYGRDEEDEDPHMYTWWTGDYTMVSGTELMTLTESGILTVASGIYVNSTAVSLEGHSHEGDYYTEAEMDGIISTVSGSLHEEINTFSGTIYTSLVDMSESITTSGVFYSPQVDTLYFGPPTSSGTWRFTVDDGKMKLQLYNGADWDTATSWSGVG